MNRNSCLLSRQTNLLFGQTKISRQRGSILGYTLLFLFLFIALSIVALKLSDMSSAMGFRAAQKIQATALAEAGVQTLYDDIRTALATGGTPPTTHGMTNMSVTLNGKTTNEGSFSASVISSNTVNGETEIILEGVGTAPNGVISRVRSSLLLSAQERMAAILSNTTIAIATNGGLRISETVPGRNQASILANDGLSWSPPLGSKTAVTNPNIIDIQGQIMVAANPDPAYNTTVGPSGMGNSNGTKNYRTVADPLARGLCKQCYGHPPSFLS